MGIIKYMLILAKKKGERDNEHRNVAFERDYEVAWNKIS